MRISPQKLGYLEGLTSIIINILLFGVKFWAGLKTGSVSMQADAWHTLSDTLTSFVIIIGFWIMARPADEKHPFGHGRAENITAIIVGVLLALVGFYFGSESFNHLVHRQSVNFSDIAIAVFAVSILLKEGLAQLAFWAGKKAGSRAITADGWHHRSDAIASAFIVAGALLGGRFWWMDGVLGIAVALLIVWAAIDIIHKTSSSLLGEELDNETRTDIINIIQREYPDSVSDIHHIHMHAYGSNKELTLHVRMSGSRSLSDSHKICDKLEKSLREELNLEPTIHIEPVRER